MLKYNSIGFTCVFIDSYILWDHRISRYRFSEMKKNSLIIGEGFNLNFLIAIRFIIIYILKYKYIYI